MRKYRSNAASVVRFEYGVELAEGLSQFPETVDAGVEFTKINNALFAQYQTRTSLRTPILHGRVKIRFTQRNVDQTIRAAARSAEVADKGRRGRIFGAVFPKGVRPVVAPVGRGQVKVTVELIDRLEKCQLAGIDDYRAEWVPKLKNVLALLNAAITQHDAAKSLYDDAFGLEVALREAHLDSVDRTIGLVRAAFPRDREIQDVIFPQMDDDDSVEVEEPPAPEKVQTPA